MTRFICFLIFSCTTLLATAQFGRPGQPMPNNTNSEEEMQDYDPSRLVFGGNLGLTFGDFTFVNLSPQVGYMFTDQLAAGVGINYISSSIKTRYITGEEAYREASGFAGLNIFGRFFPANFLFLSAQPEVNYSWGKIKYRNPPGPDDKLVSTWVPTLLVGGGIVVGGGGRPGRGTFISMQYDVMQNPRSPYGVRPFLNFGFVF